MTATRVCPTRTHFPYHWSLPRRTPARAHPTVIPTDVGTAAERREIASESARKAFEELLLGRAIDGNAYGCLPEPMVRDMRATGQKQMPALLTCVLDKSYPSVHLVGRFWIAPAHGFHHCFLGSLTMKPRGEATDPVTPPRFGLANQKDGKKL